MSDSEQYTSLSPTVFNDPIAEQTEWKWLSKGGANFTTHRLILKSDGNIHFKLSIQALLFVTTVVFLFSICPLIMVFAEPLTLIIAAPFQLGCAVFLYKTLKPTVFNFESGYFYHGWLKRNTSIEVQDIPCCKLDDIYALQIVSEYILGDSEVENYHSYELNIIKKDASRINVVDHSDLKALRMDMQILAEKLCVPIWDATL